MLIFCYNTKQRTFILLKIKIVGHYVNTTVQHYGNVFVQGRLPRRTGLKPLFAGAPMEVLHVDPTGPHVSSQGYRYILTACDSFTRFVVAVPLRNKTAVSAAQALVREVFLKLGTPFQILTDLGGEFLNELWKEMCKLLGITRLRTTAYCPSTNGKVERWHRSQ